MGGGPNGDSGGAPAPARGVVVMTMAQNADGRLAEELARAEGRVRQQRTELDAVLTSVGDGLLVFDVEGRVVRLSDVGRQLLGIDDPAALVGQPLEREQWRGWPPAARMVAEAVTPMIEGLRRGEMLREVEVERYGERRQVVSLRCGSIRDEDGSFAGAVVLFRDVTARRESERLTEAFLTIASGELKQPTRSIREQVRILSEEVAAGMVAPEAVAQALATITRRAEHLAERVDLLLDVSYLESGRLELRANPVDLVALAHGVIARVRAATDRGRIVLRAPPAVEGRWDGRRVARVLQDLVTDAARLSPEGETVDVSIDADHEGAVVCVRDRGPGLAPEELPHVFERFYQAEGIRRLDGVGLRLYVARAIVSAHGGRMWAESTGNAPGTTAFCFTLPYRSDTSGMAPPPSRDCPF